jgi:pilus assembly protein TadC
MLLIYDDGQRDVPLEAMVSFWVVPWRVIFYVLLALFIPALLVYIFMKWRMKKMRRQLENK